MKRLLVLLSFVATVTAWATPASGQADPPILQVKHNALFPKPVSHSGSAPIVDLDPNPKTAATIAVANPSALMEFQRRKKIDAVMSGQLRGAIEDPGPEFSPGIPQKNVIFENSPQRSVIPTNEVTAVVVGNVTDARAFVPPDKTAIYSEFSVAVKEVLKQPGNSPLFVGSTISAGRLGGAVRFPSGRISEFTYHGEGVPKVGSTYVLFLWQNPNDGEFGIYTLYEISDQKILVLDSNDLSDKLEGADATQFLALVKEKLAGAQNGVQSK